MFRGKENEKGMVIVEATIVFPVMFLVIFLMLFTGNAYLQKCRVESYVNQLAIDGAAYCVDPMLDEVEAGSIPSYDNVDIRPYRYLIGGMDDIETDIGTKIENKIRNMSSGLFSGMKPSSVIVNIKYNNGFIYSSFSVDVEYKVCIPVRLLGASDFIYMNIASHANMPVSDTTEFIRNVDMVEDYLQKYGVIEKIQEMINKAKEWFNRGG